MSTSEQSLMPETDETDERRSRARDWLSDGMDIEQADDDIFRTFVDDLPETVLCFDPAGRIVYANNAWLAMRDNPIEFYLGKRLADIVDPSNREGQLERLARLNELTIDDRVFVDDFEAKGIGWLSVVYKAWFGHDGEIRLFSAVGRNRTEYHEARQAMELANRRLADSNRDLQDFAYVASHDLQEPLRKIAAFSDRLGTKYGDALDDRGLDYLGRVQDAAGRMQQLIEDLLTYSRVATHAEAMEPVELDDVVVGVVSDLEVAIAESGATVSLGPLPAVVADGSQMRQLFQNLIGNAIKFRSPDRAPVIEVSATRSQRPAVGGQSSAEGWLVSVADNGIGFDEKYLDKIFTVFQRLHGRADYKGSGVGLSVCRRIAERHEGELIASSVPGQGSTFTVWLA